MPGLSRRVLAVAVAARLQTQVVGAVGYFGQIGRLLPGAPDGTPLDPPVKSATDPRVQPYYVLYPGAGQPGPDPDLGDTVTDLTSLVQVTVAGGDMEDVLALADRVDAALNRWHPAGAGAVVGPLRPPAGVVARLPLPDLTVHPVRLFVPLQYQFTATT